MEEKFASTLKMFNIKLTKNLKNFWKKWPILKNKKIVGVKCDRSIADYQICCDITWRCKSVIKEAKSNYFFCLRKSLNNPAITLKKYWSILHIFLHKRKIPKIPLIRHKNTFLTDTLNSSFAKQFSLVETGSELTAYYLLIHHCLESVNLDPEKISFHYSCF